MSIAKFEHVNVTVSDPKKTASMLTRLFGWKVRWEGPSKYDGYTVHVGTDEDYLALYALPQQDRPDEESYYRTGAVNHFGILWMIWTRPSRRSSPPAIAPIVTRPTIPAAGSISTTMTTSSGRW